MVYAAQRSASKRNRDAKLIVERIRRETSGFVIW